MAGSIPRKLTLPLAELEPAFWTYHSKIPNSYEYFLRSSPVPAVGSDLLSTGQVWCEPTQVCITLTVPLPYIQPQSLTVEARGLDQFGYPVSEQVSLTRHSLGSTHQGTLRAYTRLDSLTVVERENVLGTYSLGIGTSGGQEIIPGRPTNSYRLAVPNRLRSESQVKGVHVVDTGDFKTPGHKGFKVDPAHSTVEFKIGESKNDHRYLVLLLDPAWANI